MRRLEVNRRHQLKLLQHPLLVEHRRQQLASLEHRPPPFDLRRLL